MQQIKKLSKVLCYFFFPYVLLCAGLLDPGPKGLLVLLGGCGQYLARCPDWLQLKQFPTNGCGNWGLCIIGASVFGAIGIAGIDGNIPITFPMGMKACCIPGGLCVKAAPWFFILSLIILSANFLFFLETPQLVPNLSLICCRAHECDWPPIFWSTKFKKFKRSSQCSWTWLSMLLLCAIPCRLATQSLISQRLPNEALSILCCRFTELSQ